MSEEMTQDGDTLTLDDGSMLRLRIEGDSDYSINDYDSDGRIEWTRDNAYGAVRPNDFNGQARILDRDRMETLWWQPPGIEITGTPWDAETLRKEESRVRQLVEYGFVGVILELCIGKDHYGAPIVHESTSLWGVEWDPEPSYLAEIVSDLAYELERS